jgi:cyanophycinase
MTKWNLSFRVLCLLCILISSCACKPDKSINPNPDNGTGTTTRPASLGYVGQIEDVQTPTTAGTVLMGGSTDVDAAMRWMIARSGGGNVVILRATGTDAYNSYIYNLGKVASVETLKIDSRDLANQDAVAHIIRGAEMLFIAGGDQSHYMQYWKGTKVQEAIQYLLTEKKVPVGGTSAGCAILGGFYYSGEHGSVVSSEALANPFHERITIYGSDFLRPAYLEQVITDQHFSQRDRLGRQVVFLARALQMSDQSVQGIAVDEKTAVCIDANGKATVLGAHQAFFLKSDRRFLPETCEAGKPLYWDRDQKALSVYCIQASVTGAGSFDVKTFDFAQASGGTSEFWWVNQGVLNRK